LLLYLLFLSLRKPVLAKLGIRNIPRLPAQSVLIVLGLTLSTIIIVSSLITGDTLSYSVQRHAVEAYGQVDEVIAPPLLSALASLANEPPANANVDATDTVSDTTASQSQEQLNQLMQGGLTSVLTVLEGGLPGISTARYQQLRAEAAKEPEIDAVASSILFPTIIRNDTTGQGEPLGFVFAVDSDYDQQFGLTAVTGEAVKMDALQPGVGNIFAQAGNLFSLAQNAGQRVLGDNFKISDVALATAAVGAVLTSGSTAGVDLAKVSIPLTALRNLGIDTTLLESQGITQSVSLAALGVTSTTLESIGVNTTTVSLDSVGINPSSAQTVTNNLLNALNLNTLGTEIDRVLAQYGLQLRQGDLYLNQLGADNLNAHVGDVLEIFVGPIPIPFRVKAIVQQAGPIGALLPVVMIRLDEAQKLFFMTGKVNNVLISNKGDELTGLARTDAVSKRLKVLALDPATVQQVVDILRKPAVRSVVTAEAARIEEKIQDEIRAPAIIASLVESFGGMQEYAQQVKALPGELDQPSASDNLRILLSNNNVREWLTDLNLPAQDATALKNALGALNQFDVLDPLSKATVVQVANVGGKVFTSIFSLFGIFSVLAGIMLIFLIFVMLAAERRSEMGMARAIGVQRTHLVQMFVTEGVLYDLVAALFGVALGLGISYLMVGFLGGIFNNVSNQIGVPGTIFRFYFHVQPSSILIAYCLGVLLTFVVVTIASWRVSHLNIVAAIRGLSEETNAKTRSRLNKVWRWVLGPLLILLGVYVWFASWGDGQTNVLMGVSLLLTGMMIFVERWLERTTLRQTQIQRLVYTVIGLGLLITWVLPWNTILGYSAAIRDQNSPLFLAAFALRAPLIILGGIMTVMFNADALSWVFSRLVGGIGALTPVLKTAIAYPLSTRFRTGMAMIMFAMIICTVVIMAVVIQATQSLITLDAKQSAGFEIKTSSTLLSFFDPITDLQARIAKETRADLSGVAVVAAVGSTSVEASQLPVGGSVTTTQAINNFANLELTGVNLGYWQQAEKVYHFKARAPGYADDAAVWQALRDRDDVAIVTPGLLASVVQTTEVTATVGGVAASKQLTTDPQTGQTSVQFDAGNEDEFGDRRRFRNFRLTGVDQNATQLPEIKLALRADNATNPTLHQVQVIGVLDDNSTLAGGRIQTNLTTLATLTGAPVTPSNFYVKVRDGADVHVVARELERAFLSSGLDATVMAESFAAGKNVARGILQLFQGFMALGLLVGIAALGVISSRTVVERRQQVGMLRAIGYQARMVAFSFLLESSFIALTGIFIGAVAGLILGQNIVATFFATLTPESHFVLPWLQI
ncbi:MAG: FtsX-like permease family protein, partial [Chloroflexi bacterium]|nr:FtsX-like permease family protein [Chloroflexota bacterium]